LRYFKARPAWANYKKGFSIVKHCFFRSFTTAVLLVLCTSVIGFAQRNRTPTSAKATLLSSLPPSDAVAIVNVNRVLNEALPKLLAENPAKLAEVTSELAKFKTQTGLDPRSFEQVALGFGYKYPREGITKISTVALARGTFSAGGLVAAGRLAANGKYQEQKYQGKTIYIYTLERQLRLFGLWDVKVGDLAVAALDSNTLALGDPDAVRGAIDAMKAGRHPNAELLTLASRDPNAIVGFGGNVSPKLLENLSLSNDTIARELTAVRQVYGTLGMNTVDLELMLTARTVDTYSAKNLGETVEGLKQLGGLFINRLTGAKGALARNALENLKTTTTGNEVQVRTAVAQSQVVPLISGN
jgi:hypothetical protein